jgi:hypothetical protein
MPAGGLPCHDHDCADADCGVLYSLYTHIDTPRVRLPAASFNLNASATTTVAKSTGCTMVP